MVGYMYGAPSFPNHNVKQYVQPCRISSSVSASTVTVAAVHYHPCQHSTALIQRVK